MTLFTQYMEDRQFPIQRKQIRDSQMGEVYQGTTANGDKLSLGDVKMFCN